ncbi:cryptochrome/photolyase family protein [Paludibacterium paludis]|uniref:Deoxyribodipyrimidine photo-lyase n=1 Tax=Paludibacterium paludis TaxID=1225769 RepID=A0A918U8A8_9NEIS|nr:deoxyribodipyrimidine photo-lyase [Paludibacterium paludis]GGY08225.1 deoxyribodipyrimidine photo-lyase [Paludibacterium paludis]
MPTRALCWFRRDLRLDDHAPLSQALINHDEIHCVFVFDTTILDALPRQDRRVEFIWHAVAELKETLRQQGSDLIVEHGDPATLIPRLAHRLGAHAVYCAEDYEPAARQRDTRVAETLKQAGIAFHALKDQVIFAKDEILTAAGRPYTVFTPYKNAWLARLHPRDYATWESKTLVSRLARHDDTLVMPSLDQLGFGDTDLCTLRLPLGTSGAETLLKDFLERMDDYAQTRDFPGIKGVSYLSPHLRFGTLSIRRLVKHALEHGGDGASTWLSELIWREFYQQLLWHFPHAATTSFKPEYRDLAFENDTARFEAWREGATGYPIVDAAMRQLKRSGWMHNRLRMIVASFLVKDLLIDWRWGERHFAELLLDFDLAANNGGWQWAASTGCDAQPYFRIFNPVTQSERFDPEGHFIRRYVPELATLDKRAIHAPWKAKVLPAGFTLGRDYPFPIVDHAAQREKALALFGKREG